MAYEVVPAAAVVAGNSDDEDSSDGLEAHMISSEEHSLPEAAAHTQQKHLEVGNECCMRPHTVDKVFDGHYL